MILTILQNKWDEKLLKFSGRHLANALQEGGKVNFSI